jgi:hypothetical protein
LKSVDVAPLNPWFLSKGRLVSLVIYLIIMLIFIVSNYYFAWNASTGMPDFSRGARTNAAGPSTLSHSMSASNDTNSIDVSASAPLSRRSDNQRESGEAIAAALRDELQTSSDLEKRLVRALTSYL